MSSRLKNSDISSYSLVSISVAVNFCVIGKRFVLYKKAEKDPKIDLDAI